MKIAIAIVAVVAVLAALGGYWVVNGRQRISSSSLQSKVTKKVGSSQTTCVKKDSNGAVWWCVASGGNVTSPTCWVAHISAIDAFTGGVVLKDGAKRCDQVSQLKGLMSSSG
jgi:hypothetical protein